MLALLSSGAALAGPIGLLGGCASSPGGSFGATASLPASGQNANAPATGAGQVQPVKAALLLPLGSSIQLSLVAKGLQQAAELALFERDVPGFQLVVRDDKGTPEGAGQAAMTAIADGCEIILGPLLGTSVAAVAPIARQAQVPVIAFSNDPANGGRGVHLLSFFVSSEVDRVVGHATASGRRHFAALIPDDPLGRDTEPAFRRTADQGGARIALVERYAGDLNGLMASAQRVIDAINGSANSEHPIDALFLPASDENVPRLIAMLRHHDIDASRVKLILTSAWNTPAVLNEPRLAGAWLAAPDPAGWRELSARFAKAYNAMPPRLASLSYDAVTVAASFSTQPKGQRYTPANLTRPQGFAGVDGQIWLTATGPVERSLAVLEVQSQGLVAVSPAARPAPGQLTRPLGPIGAQSMVRG
jgi:outer membrane PBP1 activator LpoA protein